MRKSTSPRMNPHGIAARILRLLTGLAVLAGFYSGAPAAAQVAELNQAQIESALKDQAGALPAFIRRMEHAMLTGEHAKGEALVDHEAILARATQRVHFDGDAEVRELFCDSTRRAWHERGVTQDFAGTRFRYLRPRSLGGRAGLLFRSSASTGAINYALLTVNEVKPGEYRVADVFIVGLNEFMSDTLRRTWLNVAAGFLGEEAHTIKGVNAEYVAHIGEVARASRLMNAGKYEQALLLAKELPASVQRERSVLLLRIEAAERVSTSERQEAYAAWLETFPDEQELPLKLVAYYSSEHRYEDAERVLRVLAGRLGPDAMLKRELGHVLFQREHEDAFVARAGLTAE
jgi:hypothetical protein